MAPLSRVGLLLGLFLLVGIGQAAVVFPAHPRVALTPQELVDWRAPAREQRRQLLLLQAFTTLERPLEVPREEGQWIFYYACPKDGARLSPTKPEQHTCPTCKAVYTDERTQAAYRTLLQDRLNEDCHRLALAYAVSGEERYARPVVATLRELARLYPTWTQHDRWGRRGALAVVGGWRYAQLLDEACGLIPLAKAYDMVADAPCCSTEDRKVIEQDLFGLVTRRLQQYQTFIEARNNHQTWFNAAYAVTALAIGDADLLQAAIDGPRGLRWQLQHSVTNDGLWYEGAMAYHFYALQAVMATVDAADRAGIDLRADARLKSLWTGPLHYAYPDGTFPVLHDSDPGSLAGRGEAYRWAARYFNDQTLAPRNGASAPTATTSADLADIGIAVLRRGATTVMLDYGQHGGHHGHPDKLNIVLYALGRECWLDPGRITYSVPEYNTWCRTTVAHNTVVIDGKDQAPDTGALWYFADTPDFTATLAASDKAYPGFGLRRFVVLTGSLLIDAFVVDGTRPATLDWLVHGQGTLAVDLPLEKRPTPLGDAHGYQHLADLQQGAGADEVRATWTLPDGRRYRVFGVGDAASEVFTGTGIGYTLSSRLPMLLRRRTASLTVFLTVTDLSGDAAGLTRVERLPLTQQGKAVPETQGLALRCTLPTGTLSVALDFREKPAAPFTLDGHPVDRCLVRYSKP